jgi:hypothetical protein
MPPRKKKTRKKGGGLSAGIGFGGVESNGELELRLEVNGHEGSCWVSKEFWEAVAEKAGWLRPGTASVLVPSEQRDRELLVLGSAASWDISRQKGYGAETRRRMEDNLRSAVAQWRNKPIPSPPEAKPRKGK